MARVPPAIQALGLLGAHDELTGAEPGPFAEARHGLAARGGETQRECEGSLQDQLVRNTICDVMEGGLKAFEQRYRRIALEGRNV